MVILNVKIDNLLLFRDFDINMSYPKKPVRSTIPREHLAERPNFRYKKVVILMGANASGKTAFGRVLMAIFNFILNKEYKGIVRLVDDREKTAEFSIDIAFSENILYRIITRVKALDKDKKDYQSSDVSVEVYSEKINKADSYESCVERMLQKESIKGLNYVNVLEHIPPLSWSFNFTFGTDENNNQVLPVNEILYAKVLEDTLRTLDPRIQKVIRVQESENTYVIMYEHSKVLIKDGKCLGSDKLSSGTIEGIDIADIITSMIMNSMDFYYCDEKFSHIHTEVEVAFLSLFIDLLGPNQQLFFTSHNTDVLEMDLPKHSFAFLKRDELNDEQITCIYASDYLKKNTDSLKNAVENDLFSISPDVSAIYNILDMKAKEVSNEK